MDEPELKQTFLTKPILLRTINLRFPVLYLLFLFSFYELEIVPYLNCVSQQPPFMCFIILLHTIDCMDIQTSTLIQFHGTHRDDTASSHMILPQPRKAAVSRILKHHQHLLTLHSTQSLNSWYLSWEKNTDSPSHIPHLFDTASPTASNPTSTSHHFLLFCLYGFPSPLPKSQTMWHFHQFYIKKKNHIQVVSCISFPASIKFSRYSQPSQQYLLAPLHCLMIFSTHLHQNHALPTSGYQNCNRPDYDPSSNYHTGTLARCYHRSSSRPTSPRITPNLPLPITLASVVCKRLLRAFQMKSTDNTFRGTSTITYKCNHLLVKQLQAAAMEIPSHCKSQCKTHHQQPPPRINIC